MAQPLACWRPMDHPGDAGERPFLALRGLRPRPWSTA